MGYEYPPPCIEKAIGGPLLVFYNNKARVRLWKRMNMAMRKLRKPRNNYKNSKPFYMYVNKLGQPMIAGHVATMDEINDLVQEFRAMDLHTNKEPNKQEVALLDSACDTCAIGGSAWIIEELTGKHIDVIGHTQHSTA